jgi:hypothetical protein
MPTGLLKHMVDVQQTEALVTLIVVGALVFVTRAKFISPQA